MPKLLHIVANNILCPKIEAVGVVAIAEMVTAVIDFDEDIVEGNPDDEDGGEGEGVPVAEVVCEEVSVDDAVAGNQKVSELNNETMSTCEATLFTITGTVICKITIPVMLS